MTKVTGPKPKGTARVSERAPVKAPKAAPAVARPKSSVFAAAKPRPMSVSGRYSAPKEGAAERSDLKAEVNSQRKANAAADGRPNPSSSSDSGMGRLGRNAGETVKSATGPLTAQAWAHPDQIVGQLTQHPANAANSGSANANQRCGPANLLAASIMNGPAAAAATLHGAASGPGLDARQRQTLHQIATHVGNRASSYEELAQAQSLMYRAGNSDRPVVEAYEAAGARMATTARGSDPAAARLAAQNYGTISGMQTTLQNGGELTAQRQALAQNILNRNGEAGTLTRMPDPQNPAAFNWVMVNGADRGDASGFNDRELQGLGSSAAGWAQSHPMADYSRDRPLGRLLERASLSDGQAATVRIAGARGDRDANHFITVGRQPDGTPYIYNPDPARGDSVLVTGEDALREAARYDGRNHRIQTDSRDGDLPNILITHPGAHGAATRHTD